MVEGDRLSNEYLWPSTDQGRDHRSESQALGGARHTGKADPGVGHRWRLLRTPQNVVPEKEAVPAPLFGELGQRYQDVRIGQFVEGREIHAVSQRHPITVAKLVEVARSGRRVPGPAHS